MAPSLRQKLISLCKKFIKRFGKNKKRFVIRKTSFKYSCVMSLCPCAVSKKIDQYSQDYSYPMTFETYLKKILNNFT